MVRLSGQQQPHWELKVRTYCTYCKCIRSYMHIVIFYFLISKEIICQICLLLSIVMSFLVLSTTTLLIFTIFDYFLSLLPPPLPIPPLRPLSVYSLLFFRWAHTMMPKQANNQSGDQNSYGYIRSYWNNNPDPGKRRLWVRIWVRVSLRQLYNYLCPDLQLYGSYDSLSVSISLVLRGHSPFVRRLWHGGHP